VVQAWAAPRWHLGALQSSGVIPRGQGTAAALPPPPDPGTPVLSPQPLAGSAAQPLRLGPGLLAASPLPD